MMDKIVTNGMSDNWFDACLSYQNEFFSPIYSSFQFLFHFDGLVCIITELLVLLPAFFRFYGFGIQQKLARFYNNARYQLIIFLYLFSLSVVICSDLQIVLLQPPACATWDGLNYQPFVEKYQSPSFTIVLTTIFICFLFSLPLFISTIWYLFSALLIFFYIFLLLSSILSGSATINQAIFGVSLGCWLFFTHRFFPPILVPIISFTASFMSLIFLIIKVCQFGVDNTFVTLSVVPGIRGCCLLVLCGFLFLRLVKSGLGFSIFTVQWSRRVLNDESSCEAVVPTVIGGHGDVFGNRLKYDIRDGIIAFVSVLIINEIISEVFHYELFQS